MSLRYRTALLAALTGSAVLVPAVSAAAAQSSAGPRCDVSNAPHKPAGTYNKVFHSGPGVPHLAQWTPQGLSTWHNWDGRGHNLLLMGMYRTGAQSYLVGINPKTGATVGTVRTKATHFGSLGVVGQWVIGQDSTHGSDPSVRRYPTSSLRAAMLNSKTHGSKPYLGPTGSPQRVHSVGFMAVTGKSVWLGRHSKANPTKMYRYRVDHNGTLHKEGGPWRVPPRTQGVLVTRDKFVFASSRGGGPGKLTVVDRSNPDTPQACVTTPSMPENMTIDGGKVYASYESGAGQYAKHASSTVRDLRTGLLRSLINLGAGMGGVGGQAAAYSAN
ncbi:MAG TPA: hypothetical protein VGL04_11630 [Sporichthyaceae bacterium]|jgi:hypothetical protein